MTESGFYACHNEVVYSLPVRGALVKQAQDAYWSLDSLTVTDL